MKKIKKILLGITSVLTLSFSSIGMSIYAVPEATYDIPKGCSIVLPSDFGTISELNLCNLDIVKCYEDKTILTFLDGTTYTLPQCDELVDYYQSDECTYLVGYAVSYFHHVYEGSDYETYDFPKQVTLPDGTLIDVSNYGDVQAVYNLNGEYMGYRYMYGESVYSATISTSSLTVGESSEETLQRGDINGDGKINVLDLLQLKKYILKIIDTLE